MIRFVLAALCAVTLASCAAMAVEEPAFTAVVQDGPIEIRDYPPLVVAEVTVDGARWEAANRGFRPLGDYIFGANAPQAKIEMTAPVLQTPAGAGPREGEKIAMTAPVIQTPADGGAGWVVRFVMPAGSRLLDMPRPLDPNVRLLETAPQRMAVVRFSGLASEGSVARETARLEAFLAARGLQALGPPTYAYYDPPWTLPFLRRNEVMIPIAAAAPAG